jgi:hypothetical protein
VKDREAFRRLAPALISIPPGRRQEISQSNSGWGIPHPVHGDLPVRHASEKSVDEIAGCVATPTIAIRTAAAAPVPSES